MLLHRPLLAAQSYSQPGEVQSLEAIHEQALKFLKQKVDQKLFEPKIHLKKLNPRVQLPQCKTAIKLQDRTPTRYTGRVTLAVQCPDPGWKTYITATIDGKLPVIMTTQGIFKKAVIKSGDVKQSYLHYKKVPSNRLISLKRVIGMRAKKSLGPNEVLTIRDLQPPYWVYKKKPVTIISRIGGIEVKTRGVALQSGVENQQVRVENTSSEKTVKGIVIAPNTVLVP